VPPPRPWATPPRTGRWPTCSSRACGWCSAIIGWRAARASAAAEVDLILRAPDGTLVFVEVRARTGHGHGGAAASVTGAKQRRIVRAAQHYLMGLPVLPPCRFDVVAIDGDQLQWLPGAFDAA
jgi:putative endonuclease